MRRARIWRSSRARNALTASCAVAGLALILAACGPVGSGSSSVGTTPVSGGVATYATIPGFPANYIFPFSAGANFTATNSDDLQYLMYRPLYWFGDQGKPYLNQQLSLAYPPVYNGHRVTIKLKSNYKWSTGQPVTAQNVMMWINMMLAEDGKGNWGAYIPGDFPDDVTGIHAVGTNKVEMTIKGAFSEDWFSYNELSQITPMPPNWDVTGPNQPSHCDTNVPDCVAVYNYLSKNAGKPSTWTSPLWSVVDGPWHVVAADNSDNVTLAFNTNYGGPVAPHHISKFRLAPFTSEQAEFNVLEDPPNGQKIDVGYLPTVDAPVPPAGSSVGANPVSLPNYKLSVVYPWQINYFPYNFKDPTAGPIFSQLYFREAFQSLTDQEGVINGPMHGYGKVTTGPVGNWPVTNYLADSQRQGLDPWALNPAHASGLLQSHGWRKNGAGIDVCVSPGTGKSNCGPGVRAGAELKFNFIYATGLDYMESGVKELVSNASLAGIKINAIPEDAGSVIGAVFGGTGSWQLAEWGGWTYDPDYLPTGEVLFGGSSVNNGGHYNNKTNNNLIQKTLTAKTNSQFLAAIHTWDNWLAAQLPVVYTPDAPTLLETANNLVIGQQDPTLLITPEDWYYVK